MGLQKRSEAMARHMDEVLREEVDNTDQLHAEFHYLQSKQTAPTGHKPKQDERSTDEQRKEK